MQAVVKKVVYSFRYRLGPGQVGREVFHIVLSISPSLSLSLSLFVSLSINLLCNLSTTSLFWNFIYFFIILYRLISTFICKRNHIEMVSFSLSCICTTLLYLALAVISSYRYDPRWGGASVSRHFCPSNANRRRAPGRGYGVERQSGTYTTY